MPRLSRTVVGPSELPLSTIDSMITDQTFQYRRRANTRVVDVAEDDALWLKVLAAYAKELRKSIASYEEVGDRGLEAKAEATFELEFCERFLPTKLGAEETLALVQKVAEVEGVREKKDMGRLMGAIMRAHRDEVDGDLVRKAAQQVLS